MSSFSFGGTHLSSYGVYLAQSNADWHIWESDYKTLEHSSDSREGAEWNGNIVQAKAFNLDCYFEEVSEYQLSSFMSLLGKDGSGALTFDERPWMTYQARSISKPEIEKYISKDGMYSGLVKFHLKAFYPFALSTINTLEDASAYSELLGSLKGNTAIINTARMPVAPVTTGGAPRTTQFVYTVHNAGNAMADTIIRVAGDVGTGILISNPLTNQVCKVVGLTKALTTNVNKWLEMNSRTGECHITNGTSKTPGWQYHDNGYVQLAGHPPIRRDIPISFSGNTVTTTVDTFTSADKGKSIFAGGRWATIMVVNNSKSVTINPPAPSPGSATTEIIRLNEVLVTPVTTMSLTKTEIVHSHTFT